MILLHQAHPRHPCCNTNGVTKFMPLLSLFLIRGKTKSGDVHCRTTLRRHTSSPPTFRGPARSLAEQKYPNTPPAATKRCPSLSTHRPQDSLSSRCDPRSLWRKGFSRDATELEESYATGGRNPR